jgi:short chain dehydrogenase
VIGVGAEKGLGASVSERLAREVFHVFVAGRTAQSLERVAAQIQSNGATATAIVADATKESDVRSLYDQVCAAAICIAEARHVRKISSAPLKSGAASSILQPSAEKTGKLFSSTRTTRGSTGNDVFRSGDQAIRVFLKSRCNGRKKSVPGSGKLMGERGSGPAIAAMINAISSTLRAIGPATTNGFHAANAGQFGTRPGDGRRPTMLQKLAGLRSEPPHVKRRSGSAVGRKSETPSTA